MKAIGVLLIDDDPGVLTTVKPILQLAGHQVAAESTGRQGIHAARSFQPEVALVDLRLPDASGLRIISELRAAQPAVRCVVVTGFATMSSALEAMRHGACDYLEKPVFESALVAAVEKAAASRRGSRNGAGVQAEAHDLARWADAVVRFMTSSRDAKTLAAFGRFVGVSTGAFRNWCRTARLSSRKSLQFARALRAVCLRHPDDCVRPQRFLDIVDLRTLSKFLIASGGTADRLPPTLDEFLIRQKLVGVEAVAAIRAALTPDGSLASGQLVAMLAEPLEPVAPTYVKCGITRGN